MSDHKSQFEDYWREMKIFFAVTTRIHGRQTQPRKAPLKSMAKLVRLLRRDPDVCKMGFARVGDLVTCLFQPFFSNVESCLFTVDMINILPPLNDISLQWDSEICRATSALLQVILAVVEGSKVVPRIGGSVEFFVAPLGAVLRSLRIEELCEWTTRIIARLAEIRSSTVGDDEVLETLRRLKVHNRCCTLLEELTNRSQLAEIQLRRVTDNNDDDIDDEDDHQERFYRLEKTNGIPWVLRALRGFWKNSSQMRAELTRAGLLQKVEFLLTSIEDPVALDSLRSLRQCMITSASTPSQTPTSPNKNSTRCANCSEDQAGDQRFKKCAGCGQVYYCDK